MSRPTMNKVWHAGHKMPAKPTVEERVQWHLEHAKACTCGRAIKAALSARRMERLTTSACMCDQPTCTFGLASDAGARFCHAFNNNLFTAAAGAPFNMMRSPTTFLPHQSFSMWSG